jgi:nucleotide-binding universal stress UspA family protein
VINQNRPDMIRNTTVDVQAQEHSDVKNLLVAIESCESITIASPIMQRTLELAHAFSSRVWLLHVVPHAHEAPFNVDSNILRREVAAEYRHEHDFLQQLAQCLRDRAIDATALLVEGKPIKMILKESERLNIDLIILGCHQHGLLYGALLDTTEDGLLGRCTRPVLYIPEKE